MTWNIFHQSFHPMFIQHVWWNREHATSHFATWHSISPGKFGRTGSLQPGKMFTSQEKLFFFLFLVVSCQFLGRQNADCFRQLEKLNVFSFFFCWHIFKSTCKQFIHEWWSKNWIVCCFPSTSWFMMDNIRFTREKISPWYPKQPFFHDAWLIFYWMIPKAFELGKMVGNHQFSIDSVYVHVWIAIVSIFLSLLLPLTLPNQE